MEKTNESFLYKVSMTGFVERGHPTISRSNCKQKVPEIYEIK